jgi:hypothetical protein
MEEINKHECGKGMIGTPLNTFKYTPPSDNYLKNKRCNN